MDQNRERVPLHSTDREASSDGHHEKEVRDLNWEVTGWMCRWTFPKFLRTVLVLVALWLLISLPFLISAAHELTLADLAEMLGFITFGSCAFVGWVTLWGGIGAVRIRRRLVEQGDTEGLGAFDRVMQREGKKWSARDFLTVPRTFVRWVRMRIERARPTDRG